MMEVLILEIEDPGCFWVTVKGYGPYVVNEIEYKNLNAEMNQFYDKSCQDADEMKPLMLEEGQVCVVFSKELKCWCRAVIKSIMSCTDHYLTECFLVDYAKYISVKSNDIRVAVEAFMQIPYRAKQCGLYRTKPVTLHINFCEDTAKIVPAKRWDCAATQYFQNLLKATTQIKAQLCAIEGDRFDVLLYVTIKNEKVCVNDDLVSKNFARFEEAKENTESPANDQESQTLNVESLPLKTVNPALPFSPVLFQEKICMNLETDHAVSTSFLFKKGLHSHQVSSTGLNGSTGSIVKAMPGLPFKENTTLSLHAGRLLQFLNSDPLKTHFIKDEQQFQNFQNVSTKGDFVFLSNKIEPSSVLETAPLFDDLKKELIRKKFLGPNFTESYCWPPIARGCDVLAISPQGNDPLLYVPPVLTFLQSESCYKSLPSRSGPLALIVCPGWKKAQLTFELLKTYSRCSRPLHPMLIIVGQNREEARNVKIHRGCEVIVTTPYSLLRLFEHHSLLFLRLCHLVFDEIEILFSEASEQYYRKSIIIEERLYSPHQIVAVGTCWNRHIARLMKEFMNDPYLVITTVEEASIYGNVQQVVQLCLNSERIAVLLRILDFTPNVQKMLIFTNSINEAEMVHQALKSNSVFSLKIHKESKFNFKTVLEHWTKKYSSGTHVVLVLTDDCMQSLGITDATCVIHFSFPPSPRIFGQRLHNMSENFHNVLEKGSFVDQEYTKARSVLLLTENDACHAPGVLHYLKRAEAEIPPELHDFTARALEAEEEKKLERPLCIYLKTLGFCKNRRVCPDRHHINVQTDMSQNVPDKITPTPGCVTVVPLHIVNATNYFGRIVDKQKDQYAILAEEINEYFKKPSNNVSVEKVEKLTLYGLYEETFFHRVQVLEISPKEEEKLFFNVTIKYIDEGRMSQVESHRLLELPARFQCLPPQAVEFIVCSVKPIDNEIEWNPRVTSHIYHKIKGKPHEAKMVLTLGNTIWVDPMVRVTRLSNLKTSVNEYNVRSEILSMGLGTDNPEHIKQLQKLCRHVKVVSHEKKLETFIKEEAVSPENVSNLPNIQESATESCRSSQMTLESHPYDGVAEVKEAEDSTLHQHKCFYPEIKWFQNEETVTAKVKIASIVDYKCEFSKEKVVFSACSGDKLYLADMELHQHILAEKSACVIKDKEAIIVLTKEKRESWCKLLKNKNSHVSFDFEHWEDFEDKGPFPVGVKKLHCTNVVTEELMDSSEDSGTESDD
ncbi:putative ATP-dependent RNA helicase TDRD12 isoform X2 [Struthio camelus]|uniref:putative ATP-dependent RNA helicase TDRD12 isoform X2 n=1 Tax=Struthio camelus TaxID=8801 RepID=UPI0036042695